MANLSKIKRERMLEYLEKLKSQNTDDESIRAITEIENALNEKKYGLVWEEHSEQVDEMLEHNIPVFIEDKDRKIVADEEQPFNFLLEGDNLHSLKLLEKTHKGKIDVIYIDPPYNRGKNDFRYDDNYIVKEDGYRHSKWLSFMEKRLLVAKELLADKGFIFISIDDNESSKLQLLLDEIFGEQNFINCFIWQRNSSVKTEKDKFTINTEYVMLYSKSRNFKLNNAYKPLSIASQKLFKFDDKDGRGKYQTVSMQKPKDPGPETTYDYIDNQGKVWKCPPKGWRMKYEKIKALENDGRLVLTGKTLRVKDYWNERKNEGKRIDTLWNDLPENSSGSSELELALGVKEAFPNPKPTKLISRCLEISKKDSIVLDFFAGSGTTGHAVAQLNKEDGGNRKYILCTNNENNICEEVTYQRLKNIQNDLPHNLKYYKTDFIEKFSQGESISEKMLSHIRELIELEHHLEIDDKHTIILENEDDIENVINRIEDGGKLFIVSGIFLSRSDQRTLEKKCIEMIEIPEYYFREELREVGEL